MTTYAGKEASAAVWRILQERRGRKELRSIGTQRHDPKLTPKSDRDRFSDN